MRAVVQAVVIFVLLVGFSVGVWIAVRIVSVYTPAAPEPTHTELVTVLLTGLTISIGALAVIVAGLAIWGYGTIKDESRKVAIQAASESAIASVKSQEMRDQLCAEARSVIAEEFAKWSESQQLASSQPAQSGAILEGIGTSETVGRPIRKKREKGADV